MNVHVKICGITTIEDALVAVDAGADAIGLVFYPASPRHVDFKAAIRIVEQLPGNVAAVGVFVNPPIEELIKAATEIGVDAFQLHGDEPPEFVTQIEFSAQRRPRPVGFLPATPSTEPSRVATIKAFRVRDRKSLEVLPRYKTDLWLLDSYVPGEPGGTGAQFNWQLAVDAARMERPIVLAGGLRPDNVADAIRTVHPHAVDVSSGVESAPGRKNPALVHAFVSAAKSASF